MRKLILFLLLLSLALPALAQPQMPDPSITPGAVLTTDVALICHPGYSRTVRHTSQALKARVYAAYGITSHAPGEYEVDHLISLELGGADVFDNLWPESYLTNPWNAHVKDRLENELHRRVCAGEMRLEDAQEMIRADWIGAYRQVFGEPPGQ